MKSYPFQISFKENTDNFVKKGIFLLIISKYYNYLPEMGQVLDYKHEIKTNLANKASSMGLPLPGDVIPLMHPTLLTSILSGLLSAFFPLWSQELIINTCDNKWHRNGDVAL